MGECEIYKEERDVLEEMRTKDECDMEKFNTQDASEQTIVIIRDGGHKKRNTIRKKRNRHPKCLRCLY